MLVSTPLESLIAQMTVAELAQRTGRSVSDLVGLVLGDRARAVAAPRAARSEAKPARGGGRKRGKTQSRGEGGGGATPRAGYDDSVLVAIKAAKGKVKAQDLRKKIGGTPLQIRAALKRLLGAGQIKSQGKARGTTYTAG